MDKVLARKRQAIERFKERLLQSSEGDKIARIILFGSVSRGEAKKESDIDLLIIATDHLKKIEDICSEISFDILLEIGEGIEPMVYCNDNIRFPSSYFIYRSSKTGEEIYKMDELPSSHRGIVNKFGELYVKSGEIERELGRKLNDGIKVRNKARYESHTEVSEKEARELIEVAKTLINHLSQKLD